MCSTDDYVEKEISIGSVKALLESGCEVEVTSPDGYVKISDFVDKGMWDEYVLEIPGYAKIRCNENHMFQTVSGWHAAKNIMFMHGKMGEGWDGLHYLCEDGEYRQGTVRTTGLKIPIVDIQVDHDNHRYYTAKVSSHNTGVGKSLAMCHLASAALAQGRNVLYVTLEMAEEKIAERIDANLFDVAIDQLKSLPKDIFRNKVDKIIAKTRGKLVIKEYPTATAHVGHFRALLSELKMKKNFTPDIVFIDYLNICASARMKGLGGSVNTYSLIKAIAEEIRGLAVEFNVPIWSATQVTRTGFANTDVELTDTSECISVDEIVTQRDGTVKRIGDVAIGDQLTSNDGYKTVMFRHHDKVKPCVKITLKSGKSIVVSREHKFPTKTSTGQVTRESVSSGLKIGYKLCSN